MPKYVLNLLLAVLVEAATAAATYLKNLLMGSQNSATEPWANHPEFI